MITELSTDSLGCVRFKQIGGAVPVRCSIPPGADYSGFPDEVRAVCAAAHTPAIVAAYQSIISMGGGI